MNSYWRQWLIKVEVYPKSPYPSRPGENVLDLFGRSGSTLIACKKTGRRCYMMELDPLYADVIVQRYEQFTGQKAERPWREE
jgi:hypothetical protein